MLSLPFDLEEKVVENHEEDSKDEHLRTENKHDCLSTRLGNLAGFFLGLFAPPTFQ